MYLAKELKEVLTHSISSAIAGRYYKLYQLNSFSSFWILHCMTRLRQNVSRLPNDHRQAFLLLNYKFQWKKYGQPAENLNLEMRTLGKSAESFLSKIKIFCQSPTSTFYASRSLKLAQKFYFSALISISESEMFTAFHDQQCRMSRQIQNQLKPRLLF